MANVVKMATKVIEAVVVSHQFGMVIVLLLFQTIYKCSLYHDRCTASHKQVSCTVYQMKTTWMCSLCHLEEPYYEHWQCKDKSSREYFQQHVDDTHLDKKLQSIILICVIGYNLF